MLLDKLIKRKIDLLDLLDKSDGITIDQLHNRMNLSKKTISSELRELLKDCPYSKEEVSIEKQGKKYFLLKKETTNIELIKAELKKGSLLFQIYSNIFQELFLIIPNVSKAYYCSPSKMYNQLALLKKSVEVNGIGIERINDHYILKGRESLIRFQAFHYFWEMSKGMENLMNKEYRKKIKRLLYDIEYNQGLNFSILDSERLTCWLWISRERVQLGKYVENKKYYEESSTEKVLDEKIKKKLELFLNDSKEVDLNYEVSFILLILKMTFEKDYYNNGRKEGNKNSVLYLGNKFVNEFRGKFDVKNECFSISFIIGEAIFYHQNLDIDLLNFNIEKYSQSESFNRDFNLFFCDFINENSLRKSNSEKLYAYVHNLCYEQLNLKSYKPLLRVMVSSSEGAFSEYKIKKELLKLNYNLKLEEKKLEMADLIVSDYINIEYGDRAFYCTSNFTPRVISSLEKKLRKLEKNKDFPSMYGK